ILFVMKTFLISIIGIMLSWSAWSQDLEPRSGTLKTHEPISAEFMFGQKNARQLHLGYFQLTSPLILHPEKDRDEDAKKINILAIAEAREHNRRSHQIDMSFPLRQLKQIRSQVQVTFGSRDFMNRTNNDYNFSKRTPDGGIRIPVYEDMSQPFIRPYPYGFYGRPYNGIRHYSPYNGYYYRR